MKILFSTSHFGFLRNFEFALRELARRGHEIRLVADRRDSLGGSRTIENLQADFPGSITVAQAPKIKDTTWQPLASALRLTLDYWRYLHPRYAASPKLTARARAQAPAIAARIGGLPILRSTAGLRTMGRVVRAVERSLPVAPEVLRFLEKERPDLLLVTPLLYFGTHQVEYVRAARQLGIRSVHCVGSWDHLTTKGLIHEVADRVIVWNEAQRTEAQEIHGIDPGRVTATGAQAYDHWFVTQPSTTREAFCARVGLRSDRPFLLYLCSSPFITPYEVGFVERWIRGLRQSRVRELREIGVLVRPHPQNADQWADIDWPGVDNVAIWPRAGANPVDRDARAEYFDSIFFGAAVVGVNTSALIESGIIGRTVYTILDDAFAATQEGTLHFRHLQSGGLVHVARTLDEHYAQVADLLTGAGVADASARAFVQSFVRPHGLDVPAAEVFADTIEAEGRRGSVARASSSPVSPLWHAALYPFAVAAQSAARRRREAARREKDAQFRDKDAPAPEEAR